MFKKFAKVQIISSSNGKPDWVNLEDYGIEKEPGFFYFACRAVSEGENDNADCFPPEELRRAYKTFEGKPLFLNHESDDVSKAIGKIVKALLIEDIPIWVKTIVALDEKNHPDLADKIRRGIITDVSMGCYVGETVCSVCGHVATNEFEMCNHIKKLKGAIDPDTKRKVFEICRNVEFYELSLVTSGADPDAMVLELLASERDSSIEIIEKLPPYSKEAQEGLFLFEKFDGDFPSYILVRKKNNEEEYLPLSFYYSYRVPGRWTKKYEDALEQLKFRGVVDENKLVNYFQTLTINPRVASLIEPVFTNTLPKENPSPEDQKLLRKALLNGAVPLNGLEPSEALSIWQKLEEKAGKVFKKGYFVKFAGRVHKVLNSQNGIAVLADKNNKIRKAVEYMLSKTFPPSKKAVFEKYLEISGKPEDEAYDAFIEGKELEFDKLNVIKAYREIIGDEIDEDKIAGLAVFLSRKPWLDLDKISENLKKNAERPETENTEEPLKTVNSSKPYFFILKFAHPSNFDMAKTVLERKGRVLKLSKDTVYLKVSEARAPVVKRILLNMRKEYGFTLVPCKKSSKTASDMDEIENHALKLAEDHWQDLINKAGDIWIGEAFLSKGDEDIVKDNIKVLFLGLNDGISLGSFDKIEGKIRSLKAQNNPAYSAGVQAGNEFSDSVLANEWNKYPDRESRVYFVGEFLNALSDILEERESEIVEIICQKLPATSESKTQKREVKAKEYDSKWFNPDGTFKGGFEGCVEYFMSKPDFEPKNPNDTKREAAEKLCAYINRQKNGSQRALAELALKTLFINIPDIEKPLNQKEAQTSDPASDGFEKGNAFGEQSFDYFADCFEEAIEGLDYIQFRSTASEFIDGMSKYYTASIEPQLKSIVSSSRVSAKDRTGKTSSMVKKAFGRREGEYAMQDYANKYIEDVKSALIDSGYTGADASEFIDGFWDGFIDYISSGIYDNIGDRWSSRKAVNKKPVKKAQESEEEMKDVLNRLFTDAEGGIVTVDGLECKFHYEDKGAFSEAHLIPTPEAKQTDTYQKEKQRLGDDWFYVFTDSEDIVNYALQAAQSNGHNPEEYKVR